jgi:glutathione S-transferase
MGLMRKSPSHQDRAAIAASAAEWNRLMAMLDVQLRRHAFVASNTFTLADIVLGLSAHRWLATPIERPALPAVQAWYDRLRVRSAFPHPEHP